MSVGVARTMLIAGCLAIAGCGSPASSNQAPPPSSSNASVPGAGTAPATQTASAPSAAAAASGMHGSLADADRKIAAPILHEVYRARGVAGVMGVPPGPTGVTVDPQGRAIVDVRAPVTEALQQRIKDLGGVVLSITPTDESTIVSMPLLAIELLADEPAVLAIRTKTVAQSGRRQ